MIEPDADTENADWTKQSWDLPPYMSKEFMEAMGPEFDLEVFKASPVYIHACENGLINDDEWVGDHLAEPKTKDAKPRGVIIHIHKE